MTVFIIVKIRISGVCALWNCDQPDRSANKMEQHVCQYSILDAVFPIEASKQQPGCAVEQETAEQEQRRQGAECLSCDGKMSCCKHQRGEDIGNDQHLDRYLFLTAEEQFPAKQIWS